MKNNKDYKIIMVISMLFAIFLVVGLSYAYFTATVTGTTKETVITSGTMALEVVDGPEITVNNIIPGTTVTKTFSIKNTGTVNTNYDVYLSEVINNFVDQTDLVYSLTSSDGGYNTVSDVQVPNAPSKIINSYAIAPNVTQNYTLTIKFLNRDLAQDDNQGKSLSAKLQLNEYKEASQVYADATGAGVPELYQGLIPVKYDSIGNTVIADTRLEWYDYAKHNWANAVLVNCSDTTIKNKYFDTNMKLKDSVVGTTITDSDILQYYVWIPRYKYLLWNAENGSSDPQAISITFEDKNATKSTGSTNGTWLTHPAFTFGTTELNGIWVGKFENSGTTTNLTIKPNVVSLTNQTVSAMFNATRDEENIYAANYGISSSEIDTHMMKNMEWGAVAYLTSSIYGRYTNTTTCIASGCEVWINNVDSGSFVGAVTGCSGATVSAARVSQTTCSTGYDWTTLGVNASTTGNQYGIYDMSGGAWEYVMGNMVGTDGNFYSSSAGFSTAPTAKYYDSYSYSESTYTDHARGLLGDATKETLKTFGSETGGWNSDYAFLPSGVYSWFVRGGYASYGVSAGVFAFYRLVGGARGSTSFRSVLFAQ
jgi:hypothetical protein